MIIAILIAAVILAAVNFFNNQLGEINQWLLIFLVVCSLVILKELLGG